MEKINSILQNLLVVSQIIGSLSAATYYMLVMFGIL